VLRVFKVKLERLVRKVPLEHKVRLVLQAL
jgi:hypothetical protein